MIAEFHLFIIWENAAKWRDAIFEDLRQHFDIIKSYKMCWPKDEFTNNLTRFYGFEITKENEHEKVLGTGEFELIILLDKNPTYMNRMTYAQGVSCVNVNVFDAKSRYRALTGRFRVHATNSVAEFRHDIALLLGEEDSLYYDGTYSFKDSPYTFFGRQLTGVMGWDNIQEVLFILSRCTDATVTLCAENNQIPTYTIQTANLIKTKLTIGVKPDDAHQVKILTNNGEMMLIFAEK